LSKPEKNLDYCDNNFHYSIVEIAGELRFQQFEVTGELAGTHFAEIVTDYFTNRPLSEVRREDVEAMRSAGDIRCLKFIVEHVLFLRQMLGN
jgi:hypothetical protein